MDIPQGRPIGRFAARFGLASGPTSPPGPRERPTRTLARTRHVERWPCRIFAATAETARRRTGRNGPPAGAVRQTQTAATSISTAQKLDPESGEYRSALRVKASWLTTGSAMGRAVRQAGSVRCAGCTRDRGSCGSVRGRRLRHSPDAPRLAPFPGGSRAVQVQRGDGPAS